MRDLQQLIDRAHAAAGVPPQRDFDTGDQFVEDKPDELVLAHAAELKKKADLADTRIIVSQGMRVLLEAADSLAALVRA